MSKEIDDIWFVIAILVGVVGYLFSIYVIGEMIFEETAIFSPIVLIWIIIPVLYLRGMLSRL